MNNFDLLIPKNNEPQNDSWLWATVMGLTPLRIRLDGDELPMSVTPETLVNNLSIGQRVWVQLTGRRVIVHGSNAGTSAPAFSLWRDPSFENYPTPSNSDWSTFWQSGGTVTSYDTTTFVEGTRSVKIDMPASSNGRYHSNTIFTVTPGAIIEMAIWGKANVVNSPVEFGLLSDVSGNPDFYNGSSTLSWQAPQITLGTTWGQHRIYIKIPDGHTVARLSINPVNGGRTYWLDGSTSVMATQAASPIPTGTIQMFAGSQLPAGWLWCQGGSFDRKTYPTLAAVLGNTYGTAAGDTYYLPDLRGRSPMGTGSVVPAQGGNAYSLGQKWGDERLQQHSHGVNDPGHAHNLSGRGTTWEANNPWGGNDVYYPVSAYGGGSPGGNYLVTSSSWTVAYSNYTGISIQNAGSGSAQNVHPILGLNFIIKT